MAPTINRRLGISVVEILAMIAMIAIIAGIILPALLGAKKQGTGTNDLGRLRQLGVAASLCREQSGAWPRGVSDVVSAGIAPKDLCSLLNDPTPDGLGNEVANALDRLPVFAPRHMALSYRNSCIGLREDRIPDEEVARWVEPGQAGGWLLDFTSVDPSKRDPYYFGEAQGRYRRLCYDGSVVTRSFRTYLMKDQGKLESGNPIVAYFVDPSEEMLQWLRSQ